MVPESEVVIAPAFEPTALFSRALYLTKDALYVRERDATISRLLRTGWLSLILLVGSACAWASGGGHGGEAAADLPLVVLEPAVNQQ